MAKVDPLVLDRLADTYQQAISRVQIAAESAALSAWFALTPDPTDAAAMALWAEAFWNITRPASDAVSATTHGYMSALNAYVGVGALLPQPDLDWFRDDFDGWVLSPIGRERDLPEGDPRYVASGAHVSKLVTAVTREAEQQAFDQIVDSIEWDLTFEWVDERPDDVVILDSVEAVTRVTGELSEGGYPTHKRNGTAKRWKRVPQGGACGFCEVLASKIYSDTAKSNRPTGAYHTFCRCSWRMLTPSEARQWADPLDDGRWRDVIDRRADVQEPTQQGDTT